MKKLFQKLVIAMLIACVMTPIFAQGAEEVSTKSADDGVVQLTFVHADGDEGKKLIVNKIVDQYNAEHDDVKIIVQSANGMSYDEFVKTKDSVGEFPDIVELRGAASMYIRAGKLAALPESLYSQFVNHMEFDGKVYTVPIVQENTFGIIYNKKYFDEHGLKEPATYDEFIELCKDIKELGDMDPLVVGAGDIWHLGFLYGLCWNDQIISRDPDFIKHCYEGSKDFNDPSFKALVNELAEIMQYAQKGWASTPDAQLTTFLVNDMAAMTYSGTHMFKPIADADPDYEMGWFPVPSHDGKIRLCGGSGISGFAISAECAEDTARYEAAVDFLNYFYSPVVYGEFCNAMNMTPATIDTSSFKGIDLLVEVMEAGKNADYLAPIWNSKAGTDELPPDFRNFTYKTVIEVLQGQRTLDSACAEINKAWSVGAKAFNPVTGIGL